MTVQLPTQPQTRASIDPRQVRVFVGGMPKSGKTTLFGDWAPRTSLILDTQHGTDLLEGEHFVIHVGSWQDFVDAVGLIAAGGHPYMTIGIDLIDDVWNLAGQNVARRLGIPAAALADYGKGVAEQEAIFRHEIGRLVSTPLGLWFLSHVDEVEGKKVGKTQYPSRMVPRIDKRIRPWLTGLSHFVFLSETISGTRQLRTTPTADFECGGRVPLPSPMPMDARELYKQIRSGLQVVPPPPPNASAPAGGDAKPAASEAAAKGRKRKPRSDIPVPEDAEPVQLAALDASASQPSPVDQAVEPAADPVTPPAPDVADAGDASAEALQEGDVPPPGSVDVTLPDGKPAEILSFLRAHGCRCQDPLRTMNEAGTFDEACPIGGHGVPWA